MTDIDIREGFLCPICMQDLGCVGDLQQHFEEAHSTEDKDVLNQLKGLFGKAKRKLLGKDKDGDQGFRPFGNDSLSLEAPVSMATSVGGIDPSMWEPQQLGATRAYTDAFKVIRDARVDRFVVETNKLLIRLDKLISTDAPADPNKRKAFEKNIVPWAPDSDVNLCTSCGKSFTLTRRRHHCRLCGGIICNKCSQFLLFSYAKKLTNPAFQYEGEGFRRSSSNSSLNSILGADGDPQIRTCSECRLLLERRDQQTEQRHAKPMVVQLYEKMKLYLDESDKHLPQFMIMAESLNAGETTYNLLEAQVLRVKIMKIYENVDVISKRISSLGVNEPDPPSPTALRLQKTIRTFTGRHLQENLLGLQSLPTDEQLARLQEQKRLEAQRRIEEERRVALEREARRREDGGPDGGGVDRHRRPPAEEAARSGSGRAGPGAGGGQKPGGGGAQRADQAVANTGWKPIEVAAAASRSSDDPMIQQMNIIRGYVKQAKQASRWDEVTMLEENLRELQNEYWQQQKAQQKVHVDTAHAHDGLVNQRPNSATGGNNDNLPSRPIAKPAVASPSHQRAPPKKEVHFNPAVTSRTPVRAGGSPQRQTSGTTREVTHNQETARGAGPTLKSALKQTPFSENDNNPFSDDYDEDPSNPFSTTFAGPAENNTNPFS